MLNHTILSPWPFYEADEIASATQTLASGKVNYWTGELGKLFEVEYAKSVGKKYGIALSNGTVALELALRVLGVKAGDEVIVTCRSYVASASCVLLLGATPVFADVEFESGNLCVETISPHITSKTKAIIPVHIGGWPCDMPAIMALAHQHNLLVIEDCAQAHGAVVAGKPVGAWGHAAIFSFCQDKIISTGGEGGMLLLDDEAAYKKAWAYKDIGRSFDAVYHHKHPEGFRWLTESAGSNFRMTEFQSAIGLKQLKKLPEWVRKRGEHAKVITKVLKQFSFLDVPVFKDDSANKNAFYRLYAKVKPNLKTTCFSGRLLRDVIINKLTDDDVPCFSGTCSEIYKEKVFSESAYLPKVPLANAEFYSDHAFCFLVHHTITDLQIETVAEKIKKILSEIELTLAENEVL